MLPKLFWPTVRKKCSSDWEKLLKFEADGWEFAKILRSLEHSIYLTERSYQFLKYIGTIKIEIGKIIGFERLAEKVSNFKLNPSFR